MNRSEIAEQMAYWLAKEQQAERAREYAETQIHRLKVELGIIAVRELGIAQS